MSAGEQQPHPMRAAEYVLGLLSAHEFAQLEKELPANPELASEVAYWEQRLAPLGLLQAPASPPNSVWPRIQSRIQPAANSAQPARQDRGLWIGVAIAASMAAFVLASVLVLSLYSPSESTPPTYASLIQDEKRDLAWLITADAADVQALQVVTMGGSYGQTWPNRSLELWLLAPGDSPISLGLLPKEGTSNIPVSPEIAGKLRQIRAATTKLAVSEEPLGGSPTGAPTGEVVFVAVLNKRNP